MEAMDIPMAQPLDAELVEAAREGDEKAFARLVERNYRMVYGLAFSRAGNWSAAEDIAQETFLVAQKRCSSGRLQNKSRTRRFI
jgi:DNA-directed RNA polymerase specialized sigma24 family protein